MNKRMRAVPVSGLMGVALLMAGCATRGPAPDLRTVPVPPAWSQGVTATEATASFETGWKALITDDRLRDVVDLALTNNRDLRVALLNIEQARATYQIQEAAGQPTLNASGGMSASRTPAQASTSGQTVNARLYSAGVGVTAYELDLFGRVSSLKDAALESYLNTEAAHRSTRLSLVAEVISAWLTLGSDRRQLALARQTLQSQQQTYRLTERRNALGAVSGLTLVQTQTAVESARVGVATYESQVQRDQNALDLLVGQAVPQRLWPSETAEVSAAALVRVPEGLSSTVLQRRPDVQAAEHLLRASHADVDAARAALYPRISLTASAGTASRSLTDLFLGGAWSLVPTVTWPIWDGGAAQSGVRKAEVTRDIRWATYEKTVQTAFREVADALSVRDSLHERLSAQRAWVQALQKSHDLAQARWKAGAEAYLTVLDAQRSLWSAQQALITLELTEQANRVTLYKVLGGEGA